MEFSLPVPTLIVAVLALWIARSNYRRSNLPVLNIEECSCSHIQGIEENECQLFCYFRVLVRNLGIPLFDVAMTLVFREKNGHGKLTFPLKRKGKTNDRMDQFAKGMIAEFFLKSYELSRHEIGMLSVLENPSMQEATLCLYSDGYLTMKWRLGGYWERCIQKWNRVAFRVNWALRREIGKNEKGLGIIKQPRVLPTLQVKAFHIAQFTDSLRRHQSKNNTMS